MISFSSRSVLVTGGSRGIGAATARLFARAGANVAIGYHEQVDTATAVLHQCRSYKVSAIALRADIAKRAEVETMVQEVVNEFGSLDVLVNNAGIWKEAAIDEMTDAQLDETLKVNLNSMFYFCTAAARQMKTQKSGVIVNISSTAGQRGEPLHSHYAATKGAAISLTKSLAVELAPYGIRVNCVAPGWVDTDMSRPSLASPEAEKILKTIPLGRVGTPDEIAGPILFAASEWATFITGEVINVNGGAVLCG
ncbi:MAG: 3-oxoacyl-ACP reductase family protein [bacterium]